MGFTPSSWLRRQRCATSELCSSVMLWSDLARIWVFVNRGDVSDKQTNKQTKESREEPSACLCLQVCTRGSSDTSQHVRNTDGSALLPPSGRFVFRVGQSQVSFVLLRLSHQHNTTAIIYSRWADDQFPSTARVGSAHFIGSISCNAYSLRLARWMDFDHFVVLCEV